MKKILFLSAILCCSLSFANVNSFLNSSGQECMYAIISNPTKSFKAVENFNDKLNVSFMEKIFQSEDDMFLWIEANLDRTKFNSILEAKFEWESISNLQIDEIETTGSSNLKSAYEIMIHIQIKTLSSKMELSDECTDKFMAYSEAHSEIYANQIDKLYSQYKGKERDEHFEKIKAVINKNDFIRMYNCTTYFKQCIGL